MADSNGRRWRDRWTRLKRLVTHPLSKLGLVAAVLLVLVGISVALYKSLAVQQYTSRATFYPQSPDRIRFILRLVNADLLNHRLIMSVRTYPEGRYRAEQSTPSQNISVEIDTILRKYWWLTGMPIPIAPFDHALNTVGDPNLFPFDYSTSSFKVKAYGFNDPNLVIPVAIEFINNVATLDVTTTVEAATDPGDLAAAAVRVHIDVGRLTTVKVYAIFCAVLCWVLAIVVLMLSMDQLGKRKQVELPILALCTAMMFALPAIRNSNPGIPPIGTLFDVYSFLYAQFMISFVAAGLIVYYIARASNAAPSPMGPILNRSDTDIKGAEAAGISNTMSVSGGQALSSIDASAAGAAAMNVDMQIDGGLGSMSMPS